MKEIASNLHIIDWVSFDRMSWLIVLNHKNPKTLCYRSLRYINDLTLHIGDSDIKTWSEIISEIYNKLKLWYCKGFNITDKNEKLHLASDSHSNKCYIPPFFAFLGEHVNKHIETFNQKKQWCKVQIMLECDYRR